KAKQLSSQLLRAKKVLKPRTLSPFKAQSFRKRQASNGLPFFMPARKCEPQLSASVGVSHALG
ncbi:MAG: hypothetical protein ACI8RN_002515, partial [Glaciecola sp.]